MFRGFYYAIERYVRAHVAGFPALRVVDVRPLTPHMRRVIFSGRGLESFADNEALHAKLLLPPLGASRRRWLSVDRKGRARIRAGNAEPVYRTYTIRAIEPARGLVTVDFVLHADGGPGASWAGAARRGDVVGIVGPRGRGLSPADWYLIAGDETALPAVARMLSLLPGESRGEVILEVDAPPDEQRFDKPPGMAVTWLHRRDGSETRLEDAVARVRWPAEGIARFVWAAAEFAVANAIRAEVRRAMPLTKANHLIVPYWRR